MLEPTVTASVNSLHFLNRMAFQVRIRHEIYVGPDVENGVTAGGHVPHRRRNRCPELYAS
jgi:hypothetical protein